MSSQRDCNTCARHREMEHPNNVHFRVPTEYFRGTKLVTCGSCLMQSSLDGEFLPYYEADPAKMVKESSFGPEDAPAFIAGINEVFSEWLVKQCENDMRGALAAPHPLDPASYQPVKFRRLTEKEMAEGMKGNPLKKSGQVSDGSSADYYRLPAGAVELQDLISFKNMNAQIGEIFRSCYRMGQASHSDALRDSKKVLFYITAEIKRLEALTKGTT